MLTYLLAAVLMADPVPSPVDHDEVEAIRASDPRVTRELPAFGG